MVIEKKLGKKTGEHLCSVVKQNMKMLRALARKVKIRHRSQQKIFHLFCTRKRDARNCLSEVLRYQVLLSRRSSVATEKMI